MAGSGNPYLETWARQPRPFGTPEGLGVEPDMGDAGISPSLRRLMRLAAQVKRQQETLAAGARGQQTISTIDTAPPASPGFKPYGASPAAANKMEQEQEAARVEQELRAAVEAGSQEAIDALLEMTGPAWDQLRTEKEQFKQYQAYLLSLDKTNPAHAAELEASVAPMQSAWRALQEKEQRLTAWGESANKGISAKAAAGIHDAAESERGLLNAGWKGVKNSWAHVLLPPAVDVLQTLGDWMQRAQRGVAGQLGYMSDALAGREGGVGNFLSNPLPVAIGRALAGDPEILERGRSAGEQWGQTMAPAFAAPAFVTRKTVEAAELATDHLGAAAGGAALLYPTIVDMVAQVKKPEGMSDEEWEATGKAAAREKKYAPAGAKAFFEVLTDPLTYISPGKALSPALKPLAPTVDKLSKKFGIAGAAKVLREVFRGGTPIEDPDWARWAINAKAAGIDGSVEFYQEAYRAEAALRQKLAALPPELRPKVQDAAPRVLEGVPLAERRAKDLVGLDPADRQFALRGLDDGQRKAVFDAEKRLKAADYQEIDVFHGTARPFAEFDANAPRVAILDKPGRGAPVRGIFFSPHKDVAENYVRYSIPRIMAEARAGGNPAGVWRGATIATDFANSTAKGTAPEVWASRAAKKMFEEAEKSHPLAWRADAAAKELPLPGVSLYSDTAVEGGRVFTFTPKEQRQLEEALLKVAQNPSLHDKAYVFTRTPKFDPRVVSTKIRGRVLDLTDARAWPKELAAAVRKSSDSEDVRVARLLDKAVASGGKFQKLNTIERSPAIQRWVKENGFDIVKKPENDEITGEFSYWVTSHDALKGRTGIEEALKDIPAEYRALAMDYINTQESKDALLAAMLKDRGISVEFADDILQGYARRRFAPKFQQHLAEHPELAEKLRQMRLTPLEGRSTKGYTSEEVEAWLRKEYKWDGDIWDRNQSGITANDFLFAADAVKRRKDLEEFVKVFGKGEAGEGRLTADEFLKEIGGVGAKGDPIPGLEGKFFSKNDVEQFRKLRHIQDDSLLRKRVIEFNNWVARSLLANPASLTKDLKGQALNAVVTDPTMLRFADEVVPQITGHALPDKDLAELMAAGLATPSFEAEIAPSAIRATKLFGGGKVGRAAGAISESGFIGGALRGVGAGLEAVGLPRAGAAVSGAGKAVGKAGRVLLKTRQETEAAFRLMTYKSAKARGLTRTEALHEVAKYWGDFSQLSKLEKGVLKGFILFFSWQLRALKIGMHQIADHPLRTRLFLSIAAGNVSDDPEFPDWIRRQGGSVIGRDKNGNPRVISLGAGSYLDPWNDIVRGEAMQRLRTDGLGGAVKGVAQGALRRLAPMFQMPIEYATNYDSFSGAQIYLESGQDTNKTRLSDHGPAAAMWLPKPLRDLLGVREVPRKDGNGISYVHVDPEWNWLFNKLAPGVGAMTSPVSAAADPRKELWEAASRALLGTPTYSIREQDLKQQAGNKVRQAREALRKSLDDTGLAMNEQGGLRFDNTSTRGQAMAADNERWKIEARNSGMSEPAYLRLKMGASYPEALRLLDFGVYLNGWDERLKELGGGAGVKLRGVRGDPLEPLKKLSKREQEKDERQRSRALRGLLR